MCNVNVIPFQFHQLLYNLVSNALKFSKPDEPPVITIESEYGKGKKWNISGLEAGTDYCRISVRDHGIGFDSNYKSQIFTIGKLLHERNEYTGTGVGLAIVKKIVENHRGIVTADSKLGKGSVFDIYIPG